MNVKELRTIMQEALRKEGLEEFRLIPKAPKAWSLPGGDIVRFFQPHAYRRPWGFVYSGTIGIEIPTLRRWLCANYKGEEGIFHSYFIGYFIVNDDILGNFMVTHDQPVPADLWAGLLGDRLAKVPDTLAGLIKAFKGNKEELGWLAHPHNRHAWEFLLNWCRDPNLPLKVPRMGPDDRIN